MNQMIIIMRMTNYRPPIPNPNKIIINMRMINYRHYYVRYGRDSKYHVVSSTQIPWWLRVRYENELNFELEHRKNLLSKQTTYKNKFGFESVRYAYPSHGRLRDVEIELTL